MEYIASTAAARYASVILWWGLLVLRLSGCSGEQGFNCPSIVSEGGILICSCTYTSPTPVNPLPTFSWPGYSTNEQLRVSPVTRDLNGSRFECVMTMGGQSSSIFYTLLVAYGPTAADLSIIGPETIDPGNSITLTCLAANVNPEPAYTWTGVTCSNASPSNECAFIPTAADDGRVVTCVAKNPYTSNTGQTAEKNFTLKLEAPTTTPPPSTTTTEETTPTPETTMPGSVTSPTSSSSSSAGVSTARPATTTGADSTSASSSASASTEPDSTASDPPVVESSTASEQTSEQSSGTTEEPASAEYKFPLAVFLGCLAGAFVLILVSIIVAFICKRKKERDVSLVNGGEAADGSYKQERSKDFYAFENNGYNKPEMREVDSPKGSPVASKPENHPQETLYPEHPLGYYSSVPTETQEASVRVDEDGTAHPIQSSHSVQDDTPPSAPIPPSAYPAHPSQATPSEGQEVSMAFDDEQEDEGERH